MSADRFRKLFDYERDAHAKVLASFETVPAERRTSPEFRKAVNVFAHMIGARLIWLFRLGAADQPPKELFPADVDAAELPGRLRAVEDQWAAYFGRLTDADLGRVFDYRSYEGEPFRNSVEDVLTQLYGHSHYHRGQIASLVKAAGGTPAMTDFIYWCRQPVREG